MSFDTNDSQVGKIRATAFAMSRSTAKAANQTAAAVAVATSKATSTAKTANEAAAAVVTKDVKTRTKTIYNYETVTNEHMRCSDGSFATEIDDTDRDDEIGNASLRTTPGAFAIHSSMSSSSSMSDVRQPPRLELRPSLRCRNSGSYSSLLLGTVPDTSGAYETRHQSQHPAAPDVATSSPFVPVPDGASSSPFVPVPAIIVGDDSNIYEGKVVGNRKDKDDNRTKRTCKFGVLFLLFLSIVVALGIRIGRPADHVNSNNNSNTNGRENDTALDFGDFGDSSSSEAVPASSASTKEKFNDLRQQKEQQRQERKDYLISLLAPISGVAGGKVFDRSSKDLSMDRIFALEWLVDDTANVTLGQQDPPIEGESLIPISTSIPEWKLVQRYVVTLLTFATNLGGWEFQSNFLSKDDECMWNQATPVVWQVVNPESNTILDQISDTLGVTCNEGGRIQELTMRWNDMSGTLPHELFYLKDTLEEINFAGGTISGTIPSSFGKLTQLKGLALNDNCLSGTIPESLSKLPSLERLNIINNGILSGSLNDFCNSNEYREGIHAIAAGECEDVVDCDCCICCDNIDYQCLDPHSGKSWKSFNTNVRTYLDVPKSFQSEKVCRSEENKLWVDEECPCYIQANNNKNTDIDVDLDDAAAATLFRSIECTKDCNQEGAQPTFYSNFFD